MCLGATRLQTFTKVISIAPALLTGFAMAFARAIGEYGSVIFIAGNMPMVSEITPLIIIGKLEQYDYAGATAVASVMLLFSFVLLLVINALQPGSASAREAPEAQSPSPACEGHRPDLRASASAPRRRRGCAGP